MCFCPRRNGNAVPHAAALAAAQRRSSELPPSFSWLHLSVDFIWSFYALLYDGLLGWTSAHLIPSGCGAPCPGVERTASLSSIQTSAEPWTFAARVKKERVQVLPVSRNGLVCSELEISQTCCEGMSDASTSDGKSSMA